MSEPFILEVGDNRYSVPSNLQPIRLVNSAGTVIYSMSNTGQLNRKGIIDLDLGSWRTIATTAIPDLAVASGNGGQLAGNSAPSLNRINAATDRGVRIAWAAAGVIEITNQFTYPADWDDTAPVTFNMMAAMAGASDTPVVAVTYFEGLGDTNAGGNSAAITGTTITQYSVTVTAANVGAYPNFATVTLTPAAHGTDILYLYSTWIEYTRKA
jgi:hypothetical protein